MLVLCIIYAFSVKMRFSAPENIYIYIRTHLTGQDDDDVAFSGISKVTRRRRPRPAGVWYQHVR